MDIFPKGIMIGRLSLSLCKKKKVQIVSVLHCYFINLLTFYLQTFTYECINLAFAFQVPLGDGHR